MRRDVVRRFVAAPADRRRRRRDFRPPSWARWNCGCRPRAVPDGPPTDSEHAECRGVTIDSVSRPFVSIFYRSGFHWGQWRFRFFGQKITRPLTDSDQIWTTHTRDQGASNVNFSRNQNSPNSRKFKFLTNFQKFISRKRAEIFSPNFQRL